MIDLEKASFVLKAMAHPTRLVIVDLLSKVDQLSVTEICEALDLEQSLISHHLLIMKMKGILGSNRNGKNIYYYLKLKEVIQVINCIDHCDLSIFD